MAPILMQAKRAADGIGMVFFGKGADAIKLPPSSGAVACAMNLVVSSVRVTLSTLKIVMPNSNRAVPSIM